MNDDVTRMLRGLREGEPAAAAELLPLVYEELRKLAAQRLAHEKPGQTLQATALVHEAYVRLVGDPAKDAVAWDHRGHFFAAAAEAMRRILVDNARRKQSLKRGGDMARAPLDEERLAAPGPRHDLLALDDALTRLEAHNADKANLVKLRYFTGLSSAEAAEVLGISVTTADRWWTYVRAWLYQEITSAD